MALEILSRRILAPEFGNSVFVWGSIISVFLAALSLGYYLGGRLADRNPEMAALARLITLAALFQAGLIMVGGQVTSAVSSLTRGSPAGTLLATTILFGPPSILLATVSPFVVRLAARDLSEVGNTAGRLYAVSTAGSEIDPAVARIARHFFFFEDDPRTRVHIEDARQYLRRSDRRWDYIYTDAYIGMSIPFHLTTVEFLDEVKRHLNPGGVVGLNLAAGLQEPFPRAILNTLSNRFETVFAFAVRGSTNLYILAIDAKITLPKTDMIRTGEELDRRLELQPSLATIARSRLEIVLDPRTAVLLTDRFAPANHLIAIGSKSLDMSTASD